MAGKRIVAWSLGVLAALGLMSLAGCGLKTNPVPRSEVSPRMVMDLSATVDPDGVRVTFTVPEAPTMRRAVEEVRLYYAYIPLQGNPDCPPCPPHLRQYKTFYLKDVLPEGADPTASSTFSYLDKSAPLGQQAVYQVLLLDYAGRKSPPSAVVRAPRVEAAAMPTELKAVGGDGKATLTWQPVTTLDNGEKAEDIKGYIVYRKGGPEGEKKLNDRPLKNPRFVDKTVKNGVTYSYKVVAVREVVENYQAEGVTTKWLKVRPGDQKPPAPPSELAGASTVDGMYLRFTPSPQQDTKGYVLERRAGGGPWRIIADMIKENVYIDKDVKTGQTYEYRVKAVDEAGNESKYSEILEIQQNP
ncbi:MAG: hypothetical protein KQJ78_04910 [Deltaproteobacteria bacterium]|nr:hypothetical protein [Deltaproteobacteria bacterium]